MKKPIVIIGLGEIGGVLARAFLKKGYPVFPLTRQMDITLAIKDIPKPEAVVVAVGEKDFHSVMEKMPSLWKPRLILLQNELLPHDWKKYGLSPTVVSIWFEKKKPFDYQVIIPSPVYGPLATLLKSVFEVIGIPCKVLDSEKKLTFELVLKNLYILTTNICGLETGGSVGELWKKYEKLMRDTADEILDIQFSLIQEKLDKKQLVAAMLKAFEGDMDHKCMGRSAKDRLNRAVNQARERKLKVPTLEKILSACRS